MISAIRVRLGNGNRERRCAAIPCPSCSATLRVPLSPRSECVRCESCDDLVTVEPTTTGAP